MRGRLARFRRAVACSNSDGDERVSGHGDTGRMVSLRDPPVASGGHAQRIVTLTVDDHIVERALPVRIQWAAPVRCWTLGWAEASNARSALQIPVMHHPALMQSSSNRQTERGIDERGDRIQIGSVAAQSTDSTSTHVRLRQAWQIVGHDSGSVNHTSLLDP